MLDLKIIETTSVDAYGSGDTNTNLLIQAWVILKLMKKVF